MIYLTDEWPRFCPRCGKDHGKPKKDRTVTQDFFAGASMSCDCGAQCQYLERGLLVLAATPTGDLARYVEE